MSEIDRIGPGAPIIPPVKRDLPIDEKDESKREQEGAETSDDDAKEKQEGEGDGGIDVYV